MISVIIPIYNVEKYLRRCLDSVVNQTYKDLEIILVNDGSTDNSLKICQEYVEKDKRIKIINKENGGLSSARNAGLDICTGEYISFIDSDDFIDYEFIKELYSKIVSVNADLAISDIKRTNYSSFKENEAKKVQSIFENDQILESFFLQKISSSVCDKLYRRSLIDKIRFKEGIFLEDIEFNGRVLLKSCKAVFTNTVSYYHFVRKGSILYQSKTSIKDKQSEDVLNIFMILEEYYIKQGLKDMNVFYLYSSNIIGTYLVFGVFSLTNRQFKKMQNYYEQTFSMISLKTRNIRLKHILVKYFPVLLLIKYKIKFWVEVFK